MSMFEHPILFQIKVYFLNRIQATIAEIDDSGRSKKLKLSTIKVMKESYQFDQSTNCELLLEFCKIAIQCGDEEIFPVVVHFITTQGRMKYVRPLYRELFKSSPAGRHLAVQTFLSFKNFYHPIAAKMLATDLGADVDADKSSSVSAEIKTGTNQTLPDESSSVSDKIKTGRNLALPDESSSVSAEIKTGRNRALPDESNSVSAEIKTGRNRALPDESSSVSAEIKTGRNRALYNKCFGSNSRKLFIGVAVVSLPVLAAVFLRKRK